MRYCETYESRPIWTYRNYPPNFYAVILRLTLHPYMLLMTEGMILHSPDCSRVRDIPEFSDIRVDRSQCITLEPDPTAYPRTRWYHNVRAELKPSFGGWKHAHVISPDLEKLGHAREIAWWHYMFEELCPIEGEDRRICTICLEPDEAVKIMIGNNPTKIFGVGSDKKTIPLTISPRIRRNDPHYRHLRGI